MDPMLHTPGLRRRFRLAPMIVIASVGFITQPATLSSQHRSLEYPMGEFLVDHMNFSDQETARVFQGQTVAKAIDPGHEAEVLAVAVGHVGVPRSFFIDNYGKKIKPLEILSAARAGWFSTPPLLSDMDDFTLAHQDVEALKNCRSGDCHIKMSVEMIHRFRQEIDWHATDHAEKSSLLFRQTLIQYLKSYLKSGSTTMLTYDDQKYSLNATAEFQALLASSPYLNAHPRFVAHVKSFTGDTLADVEDVFFWMEEDLGLKHRVLSLNHLSSYLPAENDHVALFVNKQLYANHFFEASLGITGLASEIGAEKNGFYLVHIHRFRIDALRRGGLDARMIRTTLKSRIPALLEQRLSSTIAIAEALYNTHEVEPNQGEIE
jgi:hypothetical protein